MGCLALADSGRRIPTSQLSLSSSDLSTARTGQQRPCRRIPLGNLERTGHPFRICKALFQGGGVCFRRAPHLSRVPRTNITASSPPGQATNTFLLRPALHLPYFSFHLLPTHRIAGRVRSPPQQFRGGSVVFQTNLRKWRSYLSPTKIGLAPKVKFCRRIFFPSRYASHLHPYRRAPLVAERISNHHYT